MNINISIENSHYTILIVEDSITQAMRLQYTLESAGFIVTHCENGTSALEILPTLKPHLMISDVVMPGMDGYGLCREVRKIPEMNYMPIILLTSLSDPDYVIHGLECGANGFITKPYHDSYLLARIYDAIKNHNTHESSGHERSIAFSFSGKEYTVSADPLQILEVLISTYSTVLENNDELLKAQNELQVLNSSLEQMVQNRTVQLQNEVDIRTQAERFLTFQYNLSKILAESLTLEESGDEIFKIICECSGCDLCCIWEDAHHGTVLRNLVVWAAPNVHAEEFIEYTKQSTYARGTDLLSTLWISGSLETIELTERIPSSARGEKAFFYGFRTWLVIPIITRDNPVGVMELFWLNRRDLSEQLLGLLQSFSVQIGECIARYQLQLQFFQSQKMESIGQLTGGIAHDFNNLLMIILGNLEILASQLEADSPGQRYIQTALSAIEKGAEFNQQLLAFSRKQILQPQLVNVTQCMSATVKLLKPILDVSTIIETLFPEDLYQIYVDPGQLENTLINLAVNARDAMQKQGTITIEAQNIVIDDTVVANKYDISPGEYVKISISDTGVGIPADLIEHVFEPFFTTKPAGKGTGLGLSIVYGFVKQSKGHVTIYSEANQGTTVNLYLPRAADSTPVVKKPEVKLETIRGKEKILVVEDEADLRSIIVEYLQNLGYEVIEVDNAVDGLAIIKTEPTIDVLFTDVVTPGELLGTELAEQAKEIIPTLKVLFTSGYPRNALHNKIMDSHSFENFLAKPYKIHELGVKLRQLLDG